MTDRELLERAAKAAGIPIGGWDSTDSAFYWFDRPGGCLWNPLTDDGDALRLAVKLGIDLRRLTLPHATHLQAVGSAGSAMETLVDIRLEAQPDPCAATRRAIVRAAAEMAPKEKGEQ